MNTSGRSAFRWLWAGQSTSVFGTAISKLAIPTIAIVSLGAAPLAVGVLEAAETVAFPVLGLIAGVWVDRWSRRRTMLIANAARAAALLSIPLAAAAHALHYAQLLAVALCTGITSVFFAIAYQAFVATVVPREELERANARLEFTNSAAQIGGSGLAGALIALIGAPLTVLLDVGSYLVSIATLAVIRADEPHVGGQTHAPFVAALREGIAVVFRSAVLARVVAATGIFNLGSAMLNTAYLLFAYRTLHLSPAIVGAIFALANFGFAGALLAPRLSRRWGAGPTLVGSLAVPALANCAYPLALHAPAIPVLLGVELLNTLCVPIFNITQTTMRHRLVAAAAHGRMNATFRTVVWGTLPLGTLAGGALAGAIGIVPTLEIGGTICVIAALPLLAAPVAGLRATRP